ncbi:hypothetical protein Ga0466249_000304 [Sporomusaceae bacterium BoRhaA]|uniref:CC/Se motif family (seleno)protein n=1 Tax=Pelorhabdus rhamnosifermentans TaxID=2772457 RepID=UPI001C064535|nr:CC/Se motif family (seleno)protein [Pelorhabdus rhamnosifermentans]MBU2699225.1 hypothetical protein [Pelorhabdus rhamnosifermentans]
MFDIKDDAAKYIQQHGGAIIISFTLEPAIGGCPCAGKSVTGSYIPNIAVGIPAMEDTAGYEVVQVDEIRIFYHQRLTIKQGFKAIEIKLRSLLLVKWLEITGATALSDHS